MDKPNGEDVHQNINLMAFSHRSQLSYVYTWYLYHIPRWINVGLFGYLNSNSTLESVGIKNSYIYSEGEICR